MRKAPNRERGLDNIIHAVRRAGVVVCVGEKCSIIHAEGVQLSATGALNGKPVGQSLTEVAIVVRSNR